MSISVIIPAYNEQEVIRQTIAQVHEFNPDFEIIVVDDGSTDLTPQIVTNSRIAKLVKSRKNHGKGHAIRKGLMAKTYEIALVLDADLSVPISEFNNIDLSGDKYVIKGIRKQIQSQPIYRILLGKIWQVLVWIKTGMFMDTQCPFMVIKADDKFIRNLKIKGFAFDVELITKSVKKYGIKFVQVKYYNNPDSKVTINKMIRMVMELWQIR